MKIKESEFPKTLYENKNMDNKIINYIDNNKVICPNANYIWKKKFSELIINLKTE